VTGVQTCDLPILYDGMSTDGTKSIAQKYLNKRI
jgi:hypothetical protein